MKIKKQWTVNLFIGWEFARNTVSRSTGRSMYTKKVNREWKTEWATASEWIFEGIVEVICEYNGVCSVIYNIPTKFCAPCNMDKIIKYTLCNFIYPMVVMVVLKHIYVHKLYMCFVYFRNSSIWLFHFFLLGKSFIFGQQSRFN